MRKRNKSFSWLWVCLNQHGLYSPQFAAIKLTRAFTGDTPPLAAGLVNLSHKIHFIKPRDLDSVAAMQISDEQFMHCRQCEIRNCTKEKGYTGCHQCDEFPCHHIDNFSMAVGKKVILRAVPYRREFGTEKWIRDEEARYICPECGNRVFRGAMKCNQCKVQLDLD